MNLTSKQYWQVNLTTAYYGSTKLNITSLNTVFDSGSSLTYMPTNDYNMVMGLIKAPG
jgi:hypothetical protein